MNYQCPKCMGKISITNNQYKCESCDTLFRLENNELIPIEQRQDVMNEESLNSNIVVILRECSEILNKSTKNVRGFYKKLAELVKTNPIEDEDFTKIIDLIVNKVPLESLPTYGSAFKSFTKSQQKMFRIKMLEKQFQEELLKNKNYLDISLSKYKKELYPIQNYQKITKLHKKAHGELLELTYKDNYKSLFKEIQNKFTTAANKIYTLKQVAKRKKATIAFSIAATIVTSTLITVGFIPTLQYEPVYNNYNPYYKNNIESKRSYDDESDIIGYRVTGVKGLFFDSSFPYKEIEIPEMHKDKPVIAIGNYAFENEEVESIVLPKTVTSIGESAFAYSDIKSITIPSSVETINDYAFYNCYSLESVKIEGNIQNLNRGVFSSCSSLKSVDMNNNVKYIEEEAFSNCTSLTTLPKFDALKSIDNYAFAYCYSLEYLFIPKTTNYIANYAFEGSSNLNIEYDGSGYEWSTITNADVDIDFNEYVLSYYPSFKDTYYSLEKTIKMNESFKLSWYEELGYDFVGYYTATYGGTKVTDENGNSASTFIQNKEILNVNQKIRAYSRFEPIDYTITFHSNGGTTYSDITYTIEDEIDLDYYYPSKTGYTFLGWYKTSNYLGSRVYSISNSTGNIDLYAKWSANEYTIYYLDAEDEFDYVSVTYDQHYSIPVPTKNGYAFKGYFTSENGQGTQITDEYGNSINIYTYDYDLTVYPYFTIENYTITFNSNDGSEIAPITYTIDDTIDLTDSTYKPTKTGYFFLGWYENEDFSGSPVSKIENSYRNISLYAKWEGSTYFITYENEDYGTSNIIVKLNYLCNDLTNTSINLDAGETLTYPTATRTGYILEGWYTDSTLTNKYSFSGEITESFTLYAKWLPNSNNYNKTSSYNSSSSYYSKYVNNSSSNADTNATYFIVDQANATMYYKNSNSYYYYGIYFRVENITDGTVIKSYGSYITNTSYYSLSLGADVGDVIKISAYYYDYSSSLYMYFTGTGNTSTAYVDSSYDNITLDVNYGSSFYVAPPTKIGHTFKGFYTEENGQGTQITDEYGYSINNYSYEDDLTIYPHFEVTNYTITYYNVEDASNPNTITSFTYNDTITFSNPTRDGYTFLGWYDNEDFTGTVITSISNRTTSLSLYAKWEANIYNVYFESDGSTSVYSYVKVTLDYSCDELTNTTTKLYTGDTLTYPTATRTGYILEGWYTDSTLTNKYSFSGSITESFTLYAKWIPNSNNYTKTSSYNSSSNYYSKNVNNSSSYADTYATYFIIDKANTKMYYRNSSSSSSYRIYFKVENITDGTTIKSYGSYITNTSFSSLTLNADIGDVIKISAYYYSYSSSLRMYFTGTDNTSTATVSSYLTTVNNDIEYNSEYTLPKLEKTGYLFFGYYTEPNGEGTKLTDENGNSITNYSFAEDKEIYPYFVRGYTINYHTTSDVTNPNSTVIEENTSITLEDASRTGYVFLGWYDNESLTGDPIDTISNPTNNINLYPKWEANTYTITYIDEGATNSKSVTYDDDFTLSYSNSSSSYVFMGYFTEENGEGTQITDEYGYSINDYNYTEDITVYAYYEEIKYTITNNSSYQFTENNGTYTSTNHLDSSSSTLTINIMYSGTLKFDYVVSSESGYDKATIKLNGSTTHTYSGSQSGTISLSVYYGDTVTITYSKDGSASNGTDNVIISNIRFA